MKRLFATLLPVFMVLFGHATLAQTANAVVFTENGEKFIVILNGLRQNQDPETNVRINGLNAEFYKMKIIFADPTLGEKNFNLPLQLGMENTYVIKKNNKNEYVLRFVSSVQLAEAPAPPSSATVVEYNESGPAHTVQSGTVQQTTTTTTTTTSDGLPGGSVSMGLNMNDQGGSMSFQVSGMDAGSSTTVSQTTTTTTTTTSHSNAQPAPPPPAPAPVYVPGYSGPVGCPVPMNRADFESMKQSIASKSFEESKLTIAKQILNSNCLTSAQVREVMLLFSFEDSRLDFAKYAYGKTYDTGNFYKVNDAFTFESSVEELNDFISGR